MMIVLLAAFVAKWAMLCTNISVYFASDAVNPLFWKCLLFVFKGRSGVQKEQSKVKQGNRVKQPQQISSEGAADLTVVEEWKGQHDADNYKEKDSYQGGCT